MYLRPLLLCLLLVFSTSALAANKILVLEINGPIGPATQDYVQRGIAQANKNKNTAVILEINTPGGLETSMRGINEAINESRIPIISYVTPSGARAASAGTFILYGSHIAAMAPGTNMGAASPVSMLSSASSKESSTSERKALNDAAAYIRSLAQLRGRNAEWAEQAVRTASSLSAEEAKNLRVIDEIADNTPQLLQKINGRDIKIHGQTVKLNTHEAQLETITPDWRYQFLSFITNPNIVYILLLLAIYGLFFELSNPGLVLPGVVGLIALMLVLYAFQLMPINYVGLTLLLIGIAFIVFEIFVSSFGIIGIGGIIAFIIGSVMVFDITDPNFRIAWTLIIAMSLLTLIFFFMLLTLAIRSHRKAVVTGREGLIGSEGIVLTTNGKTMVRVLGEIWDATSTHPLKTGQTVKVKHVHGLSLEVEPTEQQRSELEE